MKPNYAGVLMHMRLSNRRFFTPMDIGRRLGKERSRASSWGWRKLNVLRRKGFVQRGPFKGEYYLTKDGEKLADDFIELENGNQTSAATQPNRQP